MEIGDETEMSVGEVQALIAGRKPRWVETPKAVYVGFGPLAVMRFDRTEPVHHRAFNIDLMAPMTLQVADGVVLNCASFEAEVTEYRDQVVMAERDKTALMSITWIGEP